MRAENLETQTKSLTDELPVCKSTGTGKATNQLYGENGSAGEQHKSYDNTFQCQQFDDRMSLYIVTSGNDFSEFAKEKLVAEILFGQLNDDNAPSDVKVVLRQAFASLERDYLNWIDECLTQQVQNMNQNRNSIEQFQSLVDEQTVDGIHIALAFIYKSKLYTCNVGKCRIILCKTDSSNVLRAVQISADCENDHRTSNNSCENLFFHCEVVGPIPLDDSQRFLVLTSSGLCKILQEIHNTEQQNINRELIQLIVQQFRTKKSLTDVAQSAVERTLSEHYAHYMQQEGNAAFKSRPDTTLMIRNFNYPLPNEARPPQNRTNVTFNPINREHLLSNNSFSSSDQSPVNDTTNSYYTNSSSTTTSSSNRSELYDKNYRIKPYVDFSDYYKNIETARSNGTLPSILRFD